MKKLLSFALLLGILIACSSDDDSTTPPVTPDPPAATFTASTTSIEAGESIDFSSTSENVSTYEWTFEGGNPATSSNKDVTVTYENAGTYTVALKVRNSNGEGTLTRVDFITVVEGAMAPVADFSAANTTIDAGQGLIFTDASTNSPTSWAWEFEGGTPATASIQNPNISYNTPGTYTVKLTATNAAGSDEETKMGYITVNAVPNPPVANFTASATTIDYNTAGTYNVSLTATNADGSDEEIKTGYITVNPLSATYTVTFQGNWTAANHPTDFPSSDHFSKAVGMVHKQGTVFFEEGSLASPGVEIMAESGSNGTLRDEIEAIVNAGDALNYINGASLGTGDASQTFTIEVNEEFGFVTLVSMIAPSPDWFVAVKDVPLFAEGDFVPNVTINAGSYDSGTDSGPTFLSPNEDTNPAENIHIITEAPLGNGTSVDPHVASFTFQKN